MPKTCSKSIFLNEWELNIKTYQPLLKSHCNKNQHHVNLLINNQIHGN